MTKHLLLQDGTELWRRELQAKPHRHDCNLIDVNQDGLKDCIVVGHEGLLTAIDPKTGENRHNNTMHGSNLQLKAGFGIGNRNHYQFGFRLKSKSGFGC